MTTPEHRETTRSEPFLNEPIDVEGIPRLDDEDFVGLDRRHLWPRLIGHGVVAAVVAASGVAASTQVDEPLAPLLIALGIIALLALSAGLWLLEFRRLGYQIRDHDVSFRQGVFRHSVATIPFARVQHVSIGRGPLDRALGLATLRVSSAGPNVAIAGLRDADASAMRALITERAGVGGDESPEPALTEPPPPSTGPPEPAAPPPPTVVPPTPEA